MTTDRPLGSLAAGVRLAARSLLRNGTFTWAAILALALGIGAGTAVFSVVDRILFRSLPYPHAERLVSFGMTAPIAPEEFMLGYDYFDWRDAGGPFESVGSWAAGVRDCDLNDAQPQRLRCARVDSTLLRTLEIHPVVGRDFTRDEERPNAPKTAILSYGLWQSRFGGDPGAVGKPIRLDGQSVTVAGVLPRDFELPSLETADILVPQVLDDPEQRSRRQAILLYSVGRLRPGVEPARAEMELRPLFDKSLEAVPASFR
ncbi:MAG TPA: ABC transporter permease, partial [Bryobacteraceae bacterium]